jgi:hypothetical protein
MLRLIQELAAISARVRGIRAYVDLPIFAINISIDEATAALGNFRAGIVAGTVPLIAGRDEEAGRGSRPLLDAIEAKSAEPPPDDEEVFHDDYDRPPELPAAKPKRGRAKRADARTKAAESLEKTERIMREEIEAADWRARPISDLDLPPESMERMTVQKQFRTVGELADWLSPGGRRVAGLGRKLWDAIDKISMAVPIELPAPIVPLDELLEAESDADAAAAKPKRTKAAERDPALAWRAIPLEQLDLPRIVKTILFRAGCSIAGQVADWFDTEMAPERTMARLNRPNADHEHTLEAVRLGLLAIRDGAAVAKPPEPPPDEPTAAPVESPGEAPEAPRTKRSGFRPVSGEFIDTLPPPVRTPTLKRAKPAALDPLETDPGDLDAVPLWKIEGLELRLRLLLGKTGKITTVGDLIRYIEQEKALSAIEGISVTDAGVIHKRLTDFIQAHEGFQTPHDDPDPEPAAKSFPLEDWTVRRKHNPIAVVQADGHDDAWNKAAATFGAVGITVSWGRPATGRFAAGKDVAK